MTALPDGSHIQIRRLTGDDADAVVELHGRLTDREQYLRFFTAHPGHLDTFARTLVQRTATRCAVGAFEKGRLIGVANYVISVEDPTSADVGVAVAHAEHFRGVATTLLVALAKIARRHGARWFCADILAENTDMLTMLSDAGWRRTHRFDGPALKVRIDLESVGLTSRSADGRGTRRRRPAGDGASPAAARR